MRRPLHHNRFDPDNLDYYIHDHLNVAVRVKSLGFLPTFRGVSRMTHTSHYLDVPLAAGYKHERSKRPANFCRVTLSGDLRAHGDITVYFSFGWLRRTSSVYKIKHVLVEVPHSAFHVRYGFSEHDHLVAFETELATLFNTLRTFRFNDLTHLIQFMTTWCHRNYADDRIKETFHEMKKLRPEEPEVVKKPKRESRHRMGHYPLMGHSFRGR